MRVLYFGDENVVCGCVFFCVFDDFVFSDVVRRIRVLYRLRFDKLGYD